VVLLAGLTIPLSLEATSSDSALHMNASMDRPARRSGIQPIDLPLRFEPNRGQWDAGVRYLARGPGYGLFLTPGGVTMTLLRRTTDPQPRTHRRAHFEGDVFQRAHLKLRIVNGRDVEPLGVDALPGRSNYLVGSDTNKWTYGLESYARVRYPDVLPGVDVAYYGTEQRRLEYDLILAPGVDAAQVAISFEGVLSIDVEADGSALLHLADGGELRQAPPVAFQVDGAGTRAIVASRYEKRSDDALGFSLGTYDKNRQLVIDPLVMSAQLGGSAKDFATDVTVDAQGNAYFVGTTASSDFPTVSAAQSTPGGGGFDAFVTKLNSSGAMVYSTYLGGSGEDFGTSIAVDASGSAYVLGNTGSADFPTKSAFQTSPGSQGLVLDLFVSKLSPTGTSLVYSTYLGGNGNERGVGIAVDGQGAVYVAGETGSTNFPTTAALQPTFRGGNTDGFVAKLNAAGTGLVYSTYLGGTGDDAAGSIAIDAAGNAYVAGSTWSPDFPTVSPLQGTNHGQSDAFVSKLNAAGTALGYSTYLGGSGSDFGNGVAVDSGGGVYVVGETQSTDYPTASPWQATHRSGGASDAFVSKLIAGGSALAYSTYLGGTGDDAAYAVAVDGAGRAHVGGSTDSLDFPLVNPFTTSHDGGFLSRLDSSGRALTYSSYLTSVSAIALDSSANIFVASYIHAGTASTDAYIVGIQNPAIPAVPAGNAWVIVLLAGSIVGVAHRRLRAA
jgi:hypothetical protein